MKKKTSLLTLAGLAAAAGAWRKFSEDLPIDGVIIPIDPGLKPPPPTLPVLPDRYTACPEGQYRKLIGGQWRCWLKERPGGR